MEKHLGNFVAATNMYEEALAMAELKKMMNTLPILYVHFSRLKYMITDNADAARDILIEGIKRLPNCRLLLEELINFATLHGGQRHIHVVDSVIANVISPGPDVSQGWNVKDAEHVSSLYLKVTQNPHFWWKCLCSHFRRSFPGHFSGVGEVEMVGLRLHEEVCGLEEEEQGKQTPFL
ncbi:pre-mRNA-processing factor 39-2-like isoform X2 [Humulus lupulus]|uniref:pre-mRNA-processing factor 39-2-like isoform X2 n=1 Tax=Humulus lupulus TaxID=3486 RepID=UPI002B4114FE|nr:pre-mRNA-processing factor 39-2-like isoform X2 [Humulus lupulus]